MNSAEELAVVEMTNTSDQGLDVDLHVGTTSRRVATLAPGKAILLTSPPGATWSFSPVAAPAPTGTSPRANVTDDDAPPPEDDGGRGEKQMD